MNSGDLLTTLAALLAMFLRLLKDRNWQGESFPRELFLVSIWKESSSLLMNVLKHTIVSQPTSWHKGLRLRNLYCSKGTGVDLGTHITEWTAVTVSATVVVDIFQNFFGYFCTHQSEITEWQQLLTAFGDIDCLPAWCTYSSLLVWGLWDWKPRM